MPYRRVKMEKRKIVMTHAGIYLCLILGLLTEMIVFEKPTFAASEKITLRIIYEQPITDRGHSLFKIWQEKVNASAPEKLQVKYIGANEVIPTFEQMESLRRGLVDMAVVAPTFYSGLLPEGISIQCLGPVLTVPEIRKQGILALYDKILRAKLGVTLLGGLWAGDRHMIMLKKPVDKADLSGFKLRAVPMYTPAIKMLGGTIMTIEAGETYTALQTGLLDGAVCPIVLAPDYRFEEVTRYIFYPLIPMTSWVPVHVSAELWDRLPSDVKKIVMDPLLELENRVDPFFGDMYKGILNNFERKGLKKCGPQTQAETDDLLKKIRKAQWKALAEDRATDRAWLSELNRIAKPALGIGE
jgi:TRAP-type C4-dicarboxylate transport system substrate-binding protein